ncbi:MAG: hypothetical protein ACD_46C00035G0002 [uncultured bacterium]|nr:MAG: hypothetical protein ACD_46C00035G0002 [uncultured bacterium]
MDIENLPTIYLVAEGPEGLATILDDFLEQSKDPAFAASEHFILYQLGSQKSLIKVDTSKMPFHFRYHDLLGRPATNAVKETIAQFLWEKCGEKERFRYEYPGEDD